ncbi:protein rolling stone-like [Schistocerca serialis cubense]|uniref:protein rolling stone-like n=1 Tax=Schistocerca serialis cubense TaxID=2023355 RepID=UPI00214EFF62|nr:protein rolling stone-like [Schistocerca serialis cubense]
MACEKIKEVWKKAFKPKNFKLIHDNPEIFVKSQWERKGSITRAYVFYRVVVAAFFIAALLASITGGGRVIISIWKWPIYLTNWGLTLCTVQAIFCLVIVLNAKLKRQHQISVTAGGVSATMPVQYKIYWAIHTTAATIAVCITISFWTAVYDPEQHPLDAVNILSHAMNGIMMTVDLFIVGHPMRISHLYLPLCFTVVYYVFNGIYYLAGGTDNFGRTYIYALLNWKKTGYAFLACFLGLIFVAVVHTVLSVVSSRCKHFAKPHQIQKPDETNIPC